MKKKYFALLFVVVFMVSILSGCGGSKLSGYYSRKYRDDTDYISFDGSKFTIYKGTNDKIYAGSVKEGESKDTWALYITEDDSVFPFAQYCPITVTVIDENKVHLQWSNGDADTWSKVDKDTFTNGTRSFGSGGVAVATE